MQSGYVHALSALTGNQAVQQVAAGLQSIYLSGWQVAADNNLAGQMYPDQSFIRRTACRTWSDASTSALQRADQISRLEDTADGFDWFAPIMADAEAGFGGASQCVRIDARIDRSRSGGVHFEDQLSSAKKCGHMGARSSYPSRSS